MTGRELHRIRKALGYRCMIRFGQALGMDAQPESIRRQISRYEAHDLPIPWWMAPAIRDLQRRS